MTWFTCKHEWKTIAVTYAPPTGDRIAGEQSWAMDRLIHGCTTVLQECQRCHKTRQYEMLGKILDEFTRPTIREGV
jgi:hypothetical protein